MTDEERKAWEELVELATPEYHQTICADRNAILAADAELTALRAEVESNNRMFSEYECAAKDWSAASDAIGELYEILGITKDSAGFEDGFTKIVEAAKVKFSQLTLAPPCHICSTLRARVESERRSYDQAIEKMARDCIAAANEVLSQRDIALGVQKTLRAEAKMFKERWELEQIRYEGISAANEELRARVAVLEARDDTWREKKKMLENDLGAAWKKIALLEKVVVDAIAETRKWYAINIFTPPDEDIIRVVHRQYPGMVDRLSADMARRTCDLILSNYRAALDAAKEGK